MLPVDPVGVIVSFGIILFLLSLSGCMGSLRENICLLKIFALTLGMVFFAQLLFGCVVFIYSDWFTEKFASYVNRTIKNYRDDPDLQDIIDFAQDYLECCGGGTGPDDWDNNIYFNCTNQALLNGFELDLVESCGVPFSCCIKNNNKALFNLQCGYGVRTNTSGWKRAERIYTRGCVESFEEWVAGEITAISIVLVVIGLLQIIPICCAQHLICDVEGVIDRWVVEQRLYDGRTVEKNEAAQSGSRSSLRSLTRQRNVVTPAKVDTPITSSHKIADGAPRRVKSASGAHPAPFSVDKEQQHGGRKIKSDTRLPRHRDPSHERVVTTGSVEQFHPQRLSPVPSLSDLSLHSLTASKNAASRSPRGNVVAEKRSRGNVVAEKRPRGNVVAEKRPRAHRSNLSLQGEHHPRSSLSGERIRRANSDENVTARHGATPRRAAASGTPPQKKDANSVPLVFNLWE